MMNAIALSTRARPSWWCGLVLLFMATSGASVAESQTSSSSAQERFRLFANGLYNAQELSFSGSQSFPLFLEEGTSRTSYAGGQGFAFEVGGMFLINRFLGVGASFEHFRGDHDGLFEQTLPHPLLFNQPRTLTGGLAGLSHGERAFHLDAVLTHTLRSWTLDLFGGPTFFSTSTEVIQEVSSRSNYPFDELELEQVDSRDVDDNPVGFNIGGAVTYRLTGRLGVGFQMRYSRATVGLELSGGPRLEFDAGGLHAGGGIRVHF